MNGCWRIGAVAMYVVLTCVGSSQAQNAQITALEQHVAFEQQKLQAITDQMLEIDHSVERQISNIVDRLASVSDSTDSKTKVAYQKREVIEALQNSIAFYKKMRAERGEQLVRPTRVNATDAQLAGDISNLNARVEERVNQILQITESLAENHDYETYDRYVTDAYGRRVTTHQNEKARQAERQNKRGTNLKADVADGLDEAAEALDKENTRLEQKLALAHNPEEREFLKDQISWNKELIEKRKAQFWDMTNGGGPSTQPISAKGAYELDEMFDDTRLDIKGEYRKMLELKSRRDQERSRLKMLTEQLERARRAAPAAPAPAAP